MINKVKQHIDTNRFEHLGVLQNIIVRMNNNIYDLVKFPPPTLSRIFGLVKEDVISYKA